MEILEVIFFSVWIVKAPSKCTMNNKIASEGSVFYVLENEKEKEMLCFSDNTIFWQRLAVL